MNQTATARRPMDDFSAASPALNVIAPAPEPARKQEFYYVQDMIPVRDTHVVKATDHGPQPEKNMIGTALYLMKVVKIGDNDMPKMWNDGLDCKNAEYIFYRGRPALDYYGRDGGMQVGYVYGFNFKANTAAHTAYPELAHLPYADSHQETGIRRPRTTYGWQDALDETVKEALGNWDERIRVQRETVEALFPRAKKSERRGVVWNGMDPR